MLVSVGNHGLMVVAWDVVQAPEGLRNGIRMISCCPPGEVMLFDPQNPAQMVPTLFTLTIPVYK